MPQFEKAGIDPIELGAQERPTGSVEFQDWINFPSGRNWMVVWENRDSIEDIPRIWLEQYPEDAAFEDWDPKLVSGRVWVYPGDLLALAERFRELYDAFRRGAATDAQRLPRPNWGTLAPAPEDGTTE